MLSVELFIIAILWGWWAWRDPKRAFFGLPILLPVYVVRTKIGPFPTTALELILLATLIAWFMRRRWTGVRETWGRLGHWRGPALLWLTTGLVGVLVGATHASPLPGLGLFRAYFIEPLLVFFMGMDLIRSHEDRQRLMRNFCVITIILGAWSLVQYATGWGIPHPWNAWPGRRATGPFPFPNALALFVTPIAALAFADAVSRYSDRGAPFDFALPAGRQGQGRLAPLPGPTVGWLTVAAGFLTVLLAQSDGGLVALLAAIFVTLLIHRRTRMPAIGLALIGLISVLVVVPLRSRVVEVVTFKEWSGKVRTIMWQETWTMLTDVKTPIGIARPIFGAGLAAYPTAILPYHKATWMEVFQYPHNILLNLWSETGLLGIFAFGWILVTWLRSPPKNADGGPRTALVLPLIVALLVHGLVDVPYFKNDLAVAFWMLILVTTKIRMSERA